MIGRVKERDELIRMYESDESEFVAVYGRRRVGKTYLIREVFADKFTFRHSGLAGEGVARQLSQFLKSLQDFGLEQRRRPKNWSEAFALLERVIKQSAQSRKVVFIDEMPWMDTHKSGFLSALEAFWNDFCAYRKDVLLIVCGSAAAWMVKNLFSNRGGLHNRVTCRIRLQPFTLGECRMFAAERGLAMSEMKYARGLYVLDRQTRESLDNKIAALRAVTGTHKSIHLTLVTSKGLAHTEQAQAVQSEVTLEDLF